MADRRRPMRRRAAAEPLPREETFVTEVRLFAWLAEQAGASSVRVELPRGVAAEGVIARVFRIAGLDEVPVLAGGVRLVINHEFAPAGAVVGEEDELALIPPVSGGAPPHVRVDEAPIDPEALRALVSTASDGAVLVLTFRAPGAERVHYEAYVEMAETRLRAIAEQLLSRYRLAAAAIELRVGEPRPGEPAAAVALAAPAPAPALAAAHEAIDRIRSEVPVWRLELDDGLRSWVRGDSSPADLRAS